MSRFICILTASALALVLAGCHPDYNDSNQPTNGSSPPSSGSSSGYNHNPATGGTTSSPATARTPSQP